MNNFKRTLVNEFFSSTKTENDDFSNLNHILNKNSSKYIIFGDTSHKSRDIFNFYTGKIFLNQLAKENIRTLALEIPLTLQSTLDMYLRGEIPHFAAQQVLKLAFAGDKERYDVDYRVERLLSAAKHAHKIGIDFKLIDGREGVMEHMEAFYNAEETFYSEFAKRLSGYGADTQFQTKQESQEFRSEVAHQTLADMPTFHVEEIVVFHQAYAAIPDIERLDKRLSEDSTVAERLGEIEGKIALVYGFNHFNRRSGDIDDELGAENTTTIMMLSRKYAGAVTIDGLRQFASSSIENGECDYAVVFEDNGMPSWVSRSNAIATKYNEIKPEPDMAIISEANWNH